MCTGIVDCIVLGIFVKQVDIGKRLMTTCSLVTLSDNWLAEYLGLQRLSTISPA